MKKIPFTILLALVATQAFAQGDKAADPDKYTNVSVNTARAPWAYITTSTGFNNNTGILGFSIDVPIGRKLSIEAGPGMGTWNYKAYAGIRYYLKPHQRGFAFGTGLTYCTGLRNDEHDLKTIYGYSEQIEYDKNPQTNILFAAYKYWNLGRRYNRIYMELGWSVPLTGGSKISQLSGAPMSSSQRNGIESSAPGGLIVAMGFSFGMH